MEFGLNEDWGLNASSLARSLQKSNAWKCLETRGLIHSFLPGSSYCRTLSVSLDTNSQAYSKLGPNPSSTNSLSLEHANLRSKTPSYLWYVKPRSMFNRTISKPISKPSENRVCRIILGCLVRNVLPSLYLLQTPLQVECCKKKREKTLIFLSRVASVLMCLGCNSSTKKTKQNKPLNTGIH